MHKTELLDHTAGLPTANGAAIKLARNSLSEKEIEQRRASAEKAMKGLTLASCILGVALGCISFYLVGEMVYNGEPAQRHSDLANHIAAVTMGGCSAWGVWFLCRMLGDGLSYLSGASASVEMLSPTSGTAHCEDGVRALTSGGALPTIWRDIALQERSQLYVFDIRIMQALAAAEHAAGAKRAREAELAKACRVLHGLPTSTH